MESCVVTVIFEINPGYENVFLELVKRNAIKSLQNEPGCQRFDVVQIEEQPEVIVLYEIYDDRAAFASHQTMTHFIEFDQKSTPLVAQKSVYVGTLLNSSSN